MQKYKKQSGLRNYFPPAVIFFTKRDYYLDFYITFAREDNSLRINRLVGLLENWVMR